MSFSFKGMSPEFFPAGVGALLYRRIHVSTVLVKQGAKSALQVICDADPIGEQVKGDPRRLLHHETHPGTELGLIIVTMRPLNQPFNRLDPNLDRNQRVAGVPLGGGPRRTGSVGSVRV